MTATATGNGLRARALAACATAEEAKQREEAEGRIRARARLRERFLERVGTFLNVGLIDQDTEFGAVPRGAEYVGATIDGIHVVAFLHDKDNLILPLHVLRPDEVNVPIVSLASLGETIKTLATWEGPRE